MKFSRSLLLFSSLMFSFIGFATENSDKTIAELASANPNFSTLVTALDAADLVETLNSEGPFTVFAPTNAAFDSLPAGVLDSLLGDIDALKNVLLYHVVAGASVPASVAVTLESAEMANGSIIGLEVIDGELILNGSIKVVVTDLVASNGIIHVIDGVLVPAK